MRFHLVAAVLISLWASTSEAHSFRVGLSRNQQGLPVSAVTINGTARDFVIDTGASRTAVTSLLVQDASLEKTGASRELQGAGGAVDADVYVLDSLRLGALERNGLDVQHTPLAVPGIYGVLGADLFAGLRVEYNFSDGALQIDPGGVPSHHGFLTLPFNPVNETFVSIPVQLGSGVMTGIVDTGAAFTIINPAALQAAGISPDDPRLRPAHPIRGADNQEISLKVGVLGDLVIAGISLDGVMVGVADLPVFEALGVSREPAAILGMNLLGRFDAIAVNYQTTEFQVRPKVPASPTEQSGSHQRSHAQPG